MSPVSRVLKRWKLIVVLTVLLTAAAYVYAAHRTKEYAAEAQVQIVLGAEQTGAYVDATTLEELTNVYLDVAQSAAVSASAARQVGIPARSLPSTSAFVVEPGIIAFSVTSPDAARAARDANAYAAAFVTSVATQTNSERQTRLGRLDRQLSALRRSLARVRSGSAQGSSILSEVAVVEGDIASINDTPGNAADPIGQAVVPSTAASPDPAKDAVVVFILCLALLPAAVYATSFLKRTYSDASQASEDLGLPVVASVPRRTGPNTDPTESMRLIHASCELHAAESGSDGSAVVVFASAAPGDGKTFVARSMLSALQAADTAAFFLDGDVYKRDFSSALEPDLILSELLTAKKPVAEIEAARASAPDASVVVVGEPEPLASGNTLVGNQNLAKVMHALTSDGPPVYVDTPAVLLTSDALIFARYATDVIMVVRANQTRRAEAREAVRRLRSVGAPLMGIVFNASDPRESYAGYYGSYGGYSNASTSAQRDT